MRTNSTNELHFAALKLAYHLGLGIANLLWRHFANARIDCYIPVQLVEQVSSTQIRPSRFLWLLGGSAIVASLIWLMKLTHLQGFTLLLAGLVTTVLIILLAASSLLLLQRRLHQRHRFANAKAKPIANSDKLAEDPQKESARNLQKPSLALMALDCSETLKTGDLKAGIQEISRGTPESLELEPRSLQKNATVAIDLNYPDDRESFEDSVAVSAATLQPWRLEGQFILPSGRLSWLQEASQPELQTNGDIVWDGVLMDSTERKPSEAALYESEQQFRSIFEQAGVAMAQVGENGQFLRVNQKLCQITGYSREELLTKTILEITHPEDQATDEMYLRQFDSWHRETLKLEKRYIHKTGSLVWVNVTVSLVRELNGDPKYFISVIEDITERKQAQEVLRRREEHFRSLIENASDLITFLNIDGTISYQSPSVQRILGHDSKELMGLNIFEWVHPEDIQRLNQSFIEVIQPHSSRLSVEFRFRHQNGSWHTLEAIGQTLLDEMGGIKILLNSRDITERKQAEIERWERLSLAQASLTHLSTLAAKIGLVLANGGTLVATLQLCTEALVQHLHATSAAIWTLNPASQQLQQQAASGQRLPLKPDLINLVAQTGQPYLSSEQLEEVPSYLLTNHFSGYPLVVEDRLIGVLTLLSNQPLSEDASCTISWVANAIAIAIDRSWARSELLSRRESLLFELANQIRNSLELDTILETAVQSIRSLLQIDRCHFLWYKTHETAPSWEVVNEASNPLLKSHIGPYTTSQMKLFADRLFNRQIIQIDEVEKFTDPSVRRFLLTLGYTSILSIPIETQAGEIGVITCAHCTGVRPWNNSEVELLQAVVAQLAIALDQAELYTQARQAAQVAQTQAQQLEQTLHQLKATQAQLIQSGKMSSLGQLVAGVAHEINNPVNFIHNNLAYASAYFYDILSLLRLYQEHYPNPEVTILEQAEVINVDFIANDLPKLLASMQRGTDRIRSFVLSLRNFVRLDEADMKKVDLHEGIENTLLILQHRLKAKDQQSEIQVFKEYGNLPRVECYPGQLNQVFMNILSNAIDALKESDFASQEHPPPSISIRTYTLDNCDSTQNSLSLVPDYYRDKIENSQSVVIRIADNGPGMTEAVRERLFDPFFTTKPVGQGSGLGLSISYQIVVEHHHGVLTCTSVPGQGTEFWIEIPIQQSC